MKIRPVGTELFRADGRTDMNLIVAFRSFANALKEPPNYVSACSSVPLLYPVYVILYRRLI